MQKIDITNKLYANKPIGFNSCMISGNQDQLYAQRFHGKPVKILALKKSSKDREQQNIKIEGKLFRRNGPMIKVLIPKNKPKKVGIKIIAKGIKKLKFWSNVRDTVIQ